MKMEWVIPTIDTGDRQLRAASCICHLQQSYGAVFSHTMEELRERSGLIKALCSKCIFAQLNGNDAKIKRNKKKISASWSELCSHGCADLQLEKNEDECAPWETYEIHVRYCLNSSMGVWVQLHFDMNKWHMVKDYHENSAGIAKRKGVKVHIQSLCSAVFSCKDSQMCSQWDLHSLVIHHDKLSMNTQHYSECVCMRVCVLDWLCIWSLEAQSTFLSLVNRVFFFFFFIN